MEKCFIILDFELIIFWPFGQIFLDRVVKTAIFLSLGKFFIFLKFLYASCHVWTLIGKKSAFRRGLPKLLSMFP